MYNVETLPAVRAGLDPRGDYERELAAAIEERRTVARKALEQDSERRPYSYVQVGHTGWSALVQEHAKKIDREIMREFVADAEAAVEARIEFCRARS